MRLLITLLLVLLSVTPATAQTPTPGVTPTAIPAVSLQLDQIITTTQQLAHDQVDLWSLESPTAPLLLGLMMLVFVFVFLQIVRALSTWPRADS